MEHPLLDTGLERSGSKASNDRRGILDVVWPLQLFAKAVRIFVFQQIAVKTGIGCVNRPVVVRAEDQHISANVWTIIPEVLNMMSIGSTYSKAWSEVKIANLTMVIVVRLQTVGKARVPLHLFNHHYPPRGRLQYDDAVVIVDARKRS